MDEKIKEVLKEINWQIDDYEMLAKHRKKEHNEAGEARAQGVVQGLRVATGLIYKQFKR